MSKRESILDLNKYMGKRIQVKFNGGREVTGTVKGFDTLMNLVLDDAVEYLVDLSGDGSGATQRDLGLLVCRGNAVMVLLPEDGTKEIANPWANDADMI